PAADIAGYFQSIGHPVPEGYNIADFSIDLVQQATVSSATKSSLSSQQRASGKEKCKPTETAAFHASEKNEPSDDEWSQLLNPSELCLADKSSDMASQGKSPKLQSRTVSRKRAQFLVYNARVNLPEIVSKFSLSDQFKQIMGILDSITGPTWTPSKFDTMSM
ncbi:hypothetical protein GGI02_004815, partial [Coemansia sp. RSA 2322]